MLEVNNLVKRYGDIVAVDDASFTINEGELFSFVGPSGSGKSTLLRCIAGLEEPDEGTIEIQDADMTNRKPYQRSTATVFQNLALFPNMDVGENIAYGMKRQGYEKDEIEETVKRNLELVDLEGYEDRKINELSGGEQQRVAVARSLAVQPEILLLDEPLASLDQKLRVRLREELSDLQRDLDQTSIYVTHDQDVALSISNRVGVMNAGRIEQIGTPRELYENPQTRFVAGFIGNSNEFYGTVVDGSSNGVVEVELAEGDQTVRGQAVGDVEPGENVVGTIKLEDVQVGDSGSADNEFSGEVKRSSYHGFNTKLLVEVDESLSLDLFHFGSQEFSIGEHVDVEWSSSDCRVYSG